MTTVYGGCVEPEGWDLADEHTPAPCPSCRAPAHRWFLERCECGCINTYAGLSCSTCGHVEGEQRDEP